MLAKGSSAWNIFIEFDVLEAAGYVDEPPRLAKSVLVFMFWAPPILANGSAEADLAAATGAVGFGYAFFAGALNGSAIPLLNAGPAGACTGVGAAKADVGAGIEACAAALGG